MTNEEEDMLRNHADQKDGVGKRKIIASIQKRATSSPTADDLIMQARQARSPSAETDGGGDHDRYGVARTHKGPFDNATAFSAATYEHDLPTKHQLEAARRRQSDAIEQQEANRQRGKSRTRARERNPKSP